MKTDNYIKIIITITAVALILNLFLAVSKTPVAIGAEDEIAIGVPNYTIIAVGGDNRTAYKIDTRSGEVSYIYKNREEIVYRGVITE